MHKLHKVAKPGVTLQVLCAAAHYEVHVLSQCAQFCVSPNFIVGFN